MKTNLKNSSSSKIDRKTIEKNRRSHMKCLYSQLNSLVHHGSSSSKVNLSLPDQIDEATEYIKKLQENVQNLKQKKDSLLAANGKCTSTRSYTLNSPVQINVHENGNVLEVTLVTGLECQFVFTEAIRIVHEELGDVVKASYSVAGNTVFHSIHAQIGENARSTGSIARINERLKLFAL